MRLRAGKSGSGKGAARMVAQAIAIVRAAGVSATCGGGSETTGEWEFENRNSPAKRNHGLGFAID